MAIHKPVILYYISGHGFGHSTRAIEVGRHLASFARVIFRTSAPRWLYECYYGPGLEFRPVELDCGVIQHDSLLLDEKKTLETYARILDQAPELIRAEVDFVRECGARLIVADIPPLAFEIASLAGIPSVGMANFSWDWIYGPYVGDYPEYRWLIDRIRRSYEKCGLLLRLPFHGGLTAFPRMEDIPLVVREPGNDSREAICSRLGVDPEHKLVLLSFGGFDLARLPWDSIAELKGYRFLYFRSPVNVPNVVYLSPGSFAHIDLVRVCDVVMTKPGYGICAECIRTQTPMIYTDRGEFLEYDYLVEGLKRYGRALYMPQQELVAGDWEDYLTRALQLPPARKSMRTDGAAVAARRLLELCGQG